MSYQVGFIGCGNMGGALARAVAAAGANGIAVCDRDPQKATVLGGACGAKVCSAAEIATECAFIFLGVKPQVYPEAIAEIAPALAARGEKSFTLVSMAAGLSLAAVEEMVGFSCPIIRIMPNTPCAVGAGVTVYAPNAAVTPKNEAIFHSLMAKSGALHRLPEDKIDAAGALSGCGPAFVYLFAEALADGGVEVGLSREQAAAFAAGTLKGAAEMLLAGGHPAALKDAVCSPGGTTIAGVHALEESGFRAAVMNAVTAAFDRTMELKK